MRKEYLMTFHESLSLIDRKRSIKMKTSMIYCRFISKAPKKELLRNLTYQVIEKKRPV